MGDRYLTAGYRYFECRSSADSSRRSIQRLSRPFSIACYEPLARKKKEVVFVHITTLWEPSSCQCSGIVRQYMQKRCICLTPGQNAGVYVWQPENRVQFFIPALANRNLSYQLPIFCTIHWLWLECGAWNLELIAYSTDHDRHRTQSRPV